MHLRILDPYKSRLTDRARLRAYRQGIGATCPGRVVVDLYAGLGEHTLLALRAGACRVYAVEANPRVLSLVTELVRAHGFGPDRFMPICAEPEAVELPERAEVLILGQLDALGLSRRTIDTLQRARAQLLAPGGVLLPRGVRTFIAGATSLAYAADRLFWLDELSAEGLDYRLVAELVRSRPHGAPVEQSEIRTDWAILQDVILDRPSSFRDPAPVVVECLHGGAVTGLVHAFSAEISAGVHWDTRPSQRANEVGFIALRGPVEVAPGDLIYAEVTVDSGDGSTPVELSVVHIEARHAPAFRAAMAEGKPMFAIA